MKNKTLIIALVLFQTVACFAGIFDWMGGGSTGASYNGDAYSFNDGVFTFKSDFVWTDFNTQIDGQHRFSNDKSVDDIVEFGYYRVDSKGKAIADSTQALYRQDGTVNNSVIFNKNDKIGIYMVLKETEVDAGHYEYVKYAWKGGAELKRQRTPFLVDLLTGYETKEWVPTRTITVENTYTTTSNAIDGASTARNNVDPDSRNSDTGQYFCFFSDDSSSHYEYYFSGLIGSQQGQNYDDFLREVNNEISGGTVIDITGQVIIDKEPEPTTSGQPLPGLLITLGIAGAAVAGGRAAKKAKKSN